MKHLEILNKQYQELEVQLHELDPCEVFNECEGCGDAVELIVKQMEAISIEIDILLNK